MGKPELHTQHAHAQSVTVQVSYRCGKEAKTTHRFERNGTVITFRSRDGETIEYEATGKTISDLYKWIENRLDNESNLKNKVLKIREIID